MALFKTIKIKDPKTGKERIVSPEEQEDLLEKGVILDGVILEETDNKSAHGTS